MSSGRNYHMRQWWWQNMLELQPPIQERSNLTLLHFWTQSHASKVALFVPINSDAVWKIFQFYDQMVE